MKEEHSAVSTRRSDLAILSLAAVVSVAPFFFAASGRMPRSHDISIHWMRMIAFDEVLRSGVWFPRWLGRMNDGYGAATTIFYPPFFYYLASAAHGVLDDWQASLLAAATASSLGSGLCFYGYLRLIVNRVPALTASVVYILAPYHLIDLYHRGAFPELIAFVWMPAVMYSFTKAAREGNSFYIAIGSGDFALLILTHPPEAYLFTLSLGIYAICWAIMSRSFRPALTAAGIAVLGLGLASFYAMPALLETGYIQHTILDKFKYSESYIPGLISGGGFGAMLGITAIATAAVAAISAAIGLPASLKNNAPWVGWVLVGVFAVLMMTSLGNPIAARLPRFDSVAFSWRWLAVLTMASSVLVGMGFEDAIHRPAKISRVGWISTFLAGPILFGIFASGYASNLRVAFEPPDRFIEQDFTPAPDSSSVDSLEPMVEAAIGSDTAMLIEWKPQERVVVTRSPVRFTLRIPTYDFPGWAAEIDGASAEIHRENTKGLISINVPEGEHTVRVTFRNTPLRLRAEQLSIVSSGVIVMLLIGAILGRARSREKASIAFARS